MSGFVKPYGVPNNEYAYNKNGAMTKDLNRGIVSISYNLLNLLTTIYFMAGHSTTNSYDASGVKRSTTHHTVIYDLEVPAPEEESESEEWYLAPEEEEEEEEVPAPPPEIDEINITTNYCGNIIYEGGQLKYILNPEGYAYKVGNNFYYTYYTRDHLGNNWKAGDQINNYYPSGMENQFISQNPEKQPYKFGGKELDEMHGLNWYDFEARQKDAILPMFTTMDPLAEKYYSISPYAYCLNNPVRYIDPDGRDPGDPFKSKIEAANDFAKYYNGTSIKMNREFGSTIYTNKDGTFSYNVARIGDESGSVINYELPSKTTRIGAVHTHGAEDPQYDSYSFSDRDKTGAEDHGQNEYIVTPGGQVLEYDVETKNTTEPVNAAKDIPSDPNSGTKRVNEVEAKDTKPHYIDVEHHMERPYLVKIEYNKNN
ncbi:MAG: DUF4329 domain-containing protein [Candidatus Symbiothrix sp.]|nr:DUF4329 domain-containing protein [Candidatus Symbiothrix sp.]